MCKFSSVCVWGVLLKERENEQRGGSSAIQLNKFEIYLCTFLLKSDVFQDKPVIIRFAGCFFPDLISRSSLHTTSWPQKPSLSWSKITSWQKFDCQNDAIPGACSNLAKCLIRDDQWLYLHHKLRFLPQPPQPPQHWSWIEKRSLPTSESHISASRSSCEHMDTGSCLSGHKPKIMALGCCAFCKLFTAAVREAHIFGAPSHRDLYCHLTYMPSKCYIRWNTANYKCFNTTLLLTNLWRFLYYIIFFSSIKWKGIFCHLEWNWHYWRGFALSELYSAL